ncbi:unnamed protein product [Parascedosporium putredinis]|uniref:Pectate lyase superfamily protein domain-containing protein n=1 Tax=Parascedosporium putredinis TaxID=1442378 RepID=A0A9P1ME68_9PEZI|nr:unnamed protein product [Parascedosporium putredinis]CAI8005009.1 unnamed protein product [Parascedosporium putredinis]
MRLASALLSLGLLCCPAVLADMVKDGSTCTVTPKSALKTLRSPRPTVQSPRARRGAEVSYEQTGPYPRADPALGLPENWEPRKREPQFGGGGGQASADDDTPAILDAFKQCGQDGHIILEEGDYMIRQVMDTTNLRNVHIDIYGHLEWSGDNIQYWLSNSISVTYAGRSTAWRIGGTNITMLGHGKALFLATGRYGTIRIAIRETRMGAPSA